MKGTIACRKCGKVKCVKMLAHWQAQASVYLCKKCKEEKRSKMMKTYCKNKTVKCSECSLVNYNHDCQNNELSTDMIDDVSYADELQSYLNGAREALERAIQYQDMLPDSIISAIVQLSDTRIISII